MSRKKNRRMVGDTRENRARKLAAARNRSGEGQIAAGDDGMGNNATPNRNQPQNAGTAAEDASSSRNPAGNSKSKKSFFSMGNAANIATVGGIVVQGVEGGMKVMDWVQERQISPYKEDAESWMNSAVEKEIAMEEMEERNAGIHEIFDELDELSREDSLSGSQKERARELIEKLKGSYDSKDVSVKLDEETGRITGLDKTISDRLQVEHERKIRNMESQVSTLNTASQKYTEVATNAGWGGGGIQFGGEETANEANAMKADVDKILRSKRKELQALRKQDPAGDFNNRRRRENEERKEEAEKRREEFRLRKMEDDFQSETDPEKKIANRRQLIEEEETKQAELQKSMDAAKAEVEERAGANDVPGRNEAERRLLSLQEKMDGSRERVHGLEQQISSVRSGQNAPGSAAAGTASSPSPAASPMAAPASSPSPMASPVPANPRLQEFACFNSPVSSFPPGADEQMRQGVAASMYGGAMNGIFSGGAMNSAGAEGGSQMDMIVKQLGEIKAQIRHLDATVSQGGVF